MGRTAHRACEAVSVRPGIVWLQLSATRSDTGMTNGNDHGDIVMLGKKNHSTKSVLFTYTIRRSEWRSIYVVVKGIAHDILDPLVLS